MGKSQKTLRYIDLFAGIGGFHFGLNQVKENPYTCIWANEWDQYANQIYKKHYDKCDSRDITTIEPKEIPKHDLLCAGFPCQAFSMAGQRRGFNDTRGTLFFEIAKILKYHRPRYFILENVKGLLSHERGETFKTILRILTDLGYSVQWQVLNSKNFGVPQNRERIYIVGNFRTEPRPQVFPIDRKKSKSFNHDKSIYVVDNSYPKRIRIYTDSFPTIRNYGSGGNKMPFIIQLPRGHNNGGIKKIAPTLSSNKWHFNNLLSDNLIVRKLTPIECERLQGFPDDYTKFGLLHLDKKLMKMKNTPISDTQRYKMLGNAVTTNVITAIGQALYDSISSQ